MTNGGGTANYGTIFSMNTDGTGYALIESFGGAPDGAYPRESDLTLSAGSSLLYGTTQQGGTANAGVIFSKAIVPEPTAALLLAGAAFPLLLRRRG